MRKLLLAIALSAMGIATTHAQIATQYWNGVASSAGLATNTYEFGSTSGADVSQMFTNGNYLVHDTDPGNRTMLTDVTCSGYEYTSTAFGWIGHTEHFDTLTINGPLKLSANMTWNAGYFLAGDIEYSGAGRLIMQGTGDYSARFAPGATLSVSGSSSRLQCNGGMLLNGVDIDMADNATFACRMDSVDAQSIGTLSGNGLLSNNPGNSTIQCIVTVDKLSVGTDGTIGTFNGADGGADNQFVFKLAAGSTNQFDIAKSGINLTNDFFDAGAAAMSVDVDDATIKLSHTGDALVLGDKFTIFTGFTITGTPIIDDTAATPPVDTAWAYNNGAVELVSTSDITPPAAPSGLGAIGGFYTVALDWIDNTEDDLASYNVYRSPTGGSGYSIIASNVVESTYDDNTADAPNTTYYYKVSAVDLSDNESTLSAEASATTDVDNDPAAPDGLNAIGKHDEVLLVWNPNNEAEDDLASYNVYRSTVSGSGHAIIASNVTASSFSDTNVVNGTPYYYLVSAVDTHDNEGLTSSEASATPDSDTVLPDAQHLLDDWSFTTKPDTNMSTDTEGLKEEWRWHLSQLMCQLQTTEATSTGTDSSSFTAPVNLTNHTAITSDPGYDPATTKLEAIVPAFVGTTDLRNIGVAEFAGGDQEIMAWYVITLTTTGGTYTATSDEGNMFDPSVSIDPIVAAWNRITWDVNPFANGGIPYDAITSVDVEFFHRTDVATTITGASGWFNMYQAPIDYYVTQDRLGDEYTGSLYIGNGTDATTNNPATWDAVSANWAFGEDGTYATWTNWVNGANAVILGDGANSRTVNLATNLNVTVDELMWDTTSEAIRFYGVSNSTESITVNGEIRTVLGETARQFDLYQLTLGGQFDVQNVSRLIFREQSGVAAGTEITFLDDSDIQFDGSETDFSELSVIANGSLVYNQNAVDKTLGSLSGNGEIRLVAGAELTINSLSADEAGFSANAESAGDLELGSGTHTLAINSDNSGVGSLAIGPGTLTFGGDLVVTDLGSAELSLGDSFQLIDAGSIAGSFSSVTLPSANLPAGGVWYNDLAKNGTISVGTADSRYEVINFNEFLNVGWPNRQQQLSGSLTNDAGVVVTLTLDSDVGNFAGDTNYVAGVYNSAISGVQVTTNGGVSSIGNARLDSYGSIGIEDVLDTSDDETLRFTVSVSGTPVDTIALKSLRLDTFGLDEIAEFENAGGTIVHQDTGGSDTVSFDDVLNGLTELSKANIGTWYLDVTARAYESGGVTNDTAVSFDDVQFVVGYPKTTYNLWADEINWGAADSSAGADPDEDGFGNLYEYGLGGDPLDPNDRGMWEYGSTEAGGTNYFVYIYAKRSASNADITYDLEYTTDLVYIDPTNVIPGLVVNTATLDADFDAVTNLVPTADATAKFLQLIIEAK